MTRFLPLSVSLVLALAACGSGAGNDQAESANLDTTPANVPTIAPREAALNNGSGQPVGRVVLSEDPTGTTVKVEVTKLKAGEHGLHLHETGMCTGPDFKSAGGHLNPTGKEHGRDNPKGSHLGDLANLSVGADGTASTQFLLGGTTIAQLTDADGVALVVHADPDDYKTDPSGNSGDRIACAAFN